jgi:hemerythrin-like domain-containing protein
MLLATYALLTLRIEQKQARVSIQHLQECLVQPASCAQFDCAALAARSERLIRFAESQHQSRLDHVLCPALRARSSEASESLRRLEHLCSLGRHILPRIRWALRPGVRLGQQQIAGACVLVQAYCQNLLERLACEEDVLLPLAERLLSAEAWFSVGTEFLEQDAQRA